MKSNNKIFVFILVGLTIIILTMCVRKQSYKEGEPRFSINMPYNFRTNEAERLSIKAFDLNKSGNYHEAIFLYRQAITIEPDNPKLFFDIADCLFNIDELKQAIQKLDTAIMLDSSYAPFYNNRGLYHYRLNDNKNALNNFLRAVQFDSTNYVIYANLALVYFDMKKIEEACKTLNTSKLLGLDLNNPPVDYKLMEVEDYCKIESLVQKSYIDSTIK